MPSTKPCAVVEMKVMALACVAMMERPMAYQGMVLPASRNLIDAIGAAAAPEPVGDQKDNPGEEDYPVKGSHRGAASLAGCLCGLVNNSSRQDRLLHGHGA